MAQEEALQGDLTRINQFKAQCEHLIGFTEYRYPRYRTAPHHRFVATHLERVERREIDRLMILMPPRHGKSELASKSYPFWTIGRSRIGVRVTSEDVFMLVRGWDLAGSVEGDWTVGVLMGKTRKGSYVVGDVVRFRGRPDVVADRIAETARMDTVRINILINHRMHEDDLSGRLIEQMKAGNDQWTIVELPAIALDNDQLRRPRGEALWPSHHPLEALARIRGNTLARPSTCRPSQRQLGASSSFSPFATIRKAVLGKGPLQW